MPQGEPTDPVALVRHLNASRNTLFDDVAILVRTEPAAAARVALQWTTDDDSTMVGLVNGERVDDGQHMEGAKKGLRVAMNRYVRATRDDDTGFLGDDVREGLTGVVSVELANPFVARGRLEDVEARSLVERAVHGFDRWLRDHPDQADAIVRRALEARSVRVRAREHWDRTR